MSHTMKFIATAPKLFVMISTRNILVLVWFKAILFKGSALQNQYDKEEKKQSHEVRTMEYELRLEF